MLVHVSNHRWRFSFFFVKIYYFGIYFSDTTEAEASIQLLEDDES